MVMPARQSHRSQSALSSAGIASSKLERSVITATKRDATHARSPVVTGAQLSVESRYAQLVLAVAIGWWNLESSVIMET